MFKSSSIRAKFLLALVLTIIFTLEITGIFQYYYMYNYNKSYVFEKIKLSQSIIKNELNTLIIQNDSICDKIKNDSRVVASLFIIDNYMDQNNTSNDIFNGMKKDLLEHISNKITLLNNLSYTLYDKEGRLVSHMLVSDTIGKKEAIGIFKDGKSEGLSPTNYKKVDLIADVKLEQSFINNQDNFEQYKIEYKEILGNKFLVIVKYVKIYRDDKLLGHLKLERFVDDSYIKAMAQKTKTTFDIIFDNKGFDYIKNNFNINDFDELIEVGDKFIKSDQFVFNGDTIYILNAVSKDEFNLLLKDGILIMLISVFISFIIIIPVLYFVISLDILNPIQRLFDATKAIKDNNYDIDLKIETSDITLKSFASSFVSMIEKIKQRDKEIKIRNFHDKLIASCSAKFINQDEFNDQVHSALKLIKKALKAQKISLLTFVPESKFIKKEYVLGTVCKYANICKKCKTIDNILKINRKELFFINNLKEEDRFVHCKLAKEDRIKSMVVIPIFHKDERLAALILEFSDNKNLLDENYSYLLKPLANIFGNVINQEIQEELNTNREQMLLQQSKMAAMGEMIGNIAHQWRQPLSAITTASSGLKLKQEFGLITPNDIDEFNKSILEHANYLSKTIDDFRNFFKESKEIEKFDIKRLIDSSTKLVESSYKHSHIDLKVNIIDNTFVNSYFREAMQAMINLLNNAKDAVISNNEEVKVVLVDVFRQNNDLVISIQDNGGGILDEIKEKIFEPYFTTKHQSQGTGIGLYMSSEIVSKHLKGKITVENKTFWYGNKEYFGANFRVFLPLDNKVEI